MKQLTFSLIALLITSLFVACKKDKAIEQTPSADLAGVWVGQYNYYGDDADQKYYYRFDISSNGTIKEISYYGIETGAGTWTINGKTFKATYKSNGSAGKTYSVEAVYDPASKKLTGYWGKGTKTDTGEWFMVHQ